MSRTKREWPAFARTAPVVSATPVKDRVRATAALVLFLSLAAGSAGQVRADSRIGLAPPTVQAAGAAVATAAATDAIEFLGAYSNQVHSSEHAEGFRLDLWRHGRNVVGIFSVAAGPAGDTPVGRIEGARYDAGSGRLAFRAKLSIGLRYLEPDRQLPTRDLYEFSGRIGPGSVTGVLLHHDRLEARNAPLRLRITLRRLSGDSGRDPSGARRYAVWQAWVDELLQRRGPRW
jgi:hypothetical protein